MVLSPVEVGTRGLVVVHEGFAPEVICVAYVHVARVPHAYYNEVEIFVPRVQLYIVLYDGVVALVEDFGQHFLEERAAGFRHVLELKPGLSPLRIDAKALAARKRQRGSTSGTDDARPC